MKCGLTDTASPFHYAIVSCASWKEHIKSNIIKIQISNPKSTTFNLKTVTVQSCLVVDLFYKSEELYGVVLSSLKNYSYILSPLVSEKQSTVCDLRTMCKLNVTRNIYPSVSPKYSSVGIFHFQNY
jgi:hypothetical protein